MIRNKGFLMNFRPYHGGNVTFDDGAKGRVRGVETLASARLPTIEKVCDQKMKVVFIQEGCEVLDKSKVCIMQGTRYKYNCYKLSHTYVQRDFPK